MSAKLKEDEFRDRFDAGESLESLGFDLDKAVIEEPRVKRVNVDFPDQVVAKLDRHAASMGITRQSLIKVWIFERLKEEAAKPAFVNPFFSSYRSQVDREEILKRAWESMHRMLSEAPELESKKRR
jgi:hypothetical protein